MPVSRRADSPFWWYSFSVAGRRFRGSTGCESKREAEAVERDRRRDIEKGAARTGQWTVAMVLSAYWTERAQYASDEATILTAIARLQKALGPLTRIGSIKAPALLEYRARRRGAGVKPHTVNRDYAYLRSAIRHCARFHEQPEPKVDWKALKVPEPPGRTRFLSGEEYAALMAAAHESIRPILLCAVTTGLRRENILGMEWRQVKLGERLIQVTAKGNKRHTVKLGGALMAALSRTPPDQRRGNVFDTTNFRRRFAAALEAAKIEDFRFHDLRHTFASWARIDGADLTDIRDALNHSSIAMSARYAHVTPDTHLTAFDRVSARVLGTFGDTDAKKSAENRQKTGD